MGSSLFGRLRGQLPRGFAGLMMLPVLAWAQQAPAEPAAAAPAPPPAATLANVAPSGDATRLARVRVIAPYIDLRSGPGRGYPVFYAAERDEWIVIELRHTDWFKVRTARGTLGWASREQMRQTVTEDGVPFELADPTLEDFLHRRFDVGIGYGATKNTSFTRLWAGWRFSDTLSLDLNIGNGQTKTTTTSVWTASLLAEPWSDQRLSPFIGVGIGRFHYVPNKSLVNAETNDGNLGVFTLGTRYHLASRVAVRLDYSRYGVFVSDTKSRNYEAGTIGLSIHF